MTLNTAYSFIIKYNIFLRNMAQGKVNIPSTITDVNYRYKMPKMILKIEGNGNGIKTNITNLGDVANALDVDPECKSPAN